MDEPETARIVRVTLNTQQLELLDRLVEEEGLDDRAEALRLGLRHAAEAVGGATR